MSEAEQSINAVSQSITDLSSSLSENAKRFKLSSSALVRWAGNTGKASKRWTTFSRLTSGTGLWKFQNYLRGTLEVIGGFSERTDDAIKAQTENEKALAKSVQGIVKIRKEYDDLADTLKGQKKMEDDLNKLHDRSQKNIKASEKALKDSRSSKIHLNTVNKKLAKAEEEMQKHMQKTYDIVDGGIGQRKLSQKELKKQTDLSLQLNALKAKAEKLTNKQKKAQETLNKLGTPKEIKQITEAREKEIKSLQGLTDGQKQALESTTSFSQAIIQGKTEAEAYAESFAQITENVEANQTEFDKFKKAQQDAVKFTERFKTASGRKDILEDLGKEQKELRYNSSLLQKMMDARIKLGKIEKVASKRIVNPKMLMDDMKKASDVFSKGMSKGLDKIKNLKNPFSKAARADRKLRKQVKSPLKQSSVLDKVRKRTSKLIKGIDKKLKISVGYQKFSIKVQKTALRFVAFMTPILNIAFKFLIYGILGMIAVLAIAKVAYDIMNIMASFGVFDDIKEIIGSVLVIAGAVFGIVGSFLSGDFTAMFDYLGTIMSSLMDIGWNLISIFATGLFSVAVGLFYSLIDGIFWFFDGGWKVALPALLKLGLTLLALYFIKYMLSQVLLLIGIYALPIMIFVLLAAFITAIFIKLYKEFEMVRKPVDFILGLFESLWGWITGIWKSIKGSINDVLDWFGADKLATGGLTDGNTTLVGENGPERVRLPAGSRVYSNSQSRSMTGGSTVINNHITINAKDTSDAELRRIAEKIGNMVNNKMNRTVSSRTLG